MTRLSAMLRWAASLGVVGAVAFLAGSSGAHPAAAIGFGAATGVLATLIWFATATPLPPERGEDVIRVRLADELYRSRRRGHHVALVRLALSADEPARDLLPAMIRQMDHLAIEGDQAYLLLPEASRSEADELVRRLRASVPSAFSDSTALVAVFPEDGVTERALLAAVDGHPFFAEPLGTASVHDVGSRLSPDEADGDASEREAAG